jgi:hypothetical protein
LYFTSAASGSEDYPLCKSALQVAVSAANVGKSFVGCETNLNILEAIEMFIVLWKILSAATIVYCFSQSQNCAARYESESASDADTGNN